MMAVVPSAANSVSGWGSQCRALFDMYSIRAVVLPEITAYER